MIITLHLSTGAYSSSRKPDITIANRSSCPLRSFSRRYIHPFNLALSSLPLLFPPFTHPFRASPSILPLLPSHDRLPFPPKCQQMQMFIILVNTFDNSCEQMQGLQKRRKWKTPLSHWGYHHDVFKFFSAEEKFSHFISFIFSSKEVSKLSLFEASRCFIHKFLK